MCFFGPHSDKLSDCVLIEQIWFDWVHFDFHLNCILFGFTSSQFYSYPDSNLIHLYSYLQALYSVLIRIPICFDLIMTMIHKLLNWFSIQFDLVCFWFPSFQFNSDYLNLIWFWFSSSLLSSYSDLIGFDPKSQAFWFFFLFNSD